MDIGATWFERRCRIAVANAAIDALERVIVARQFSHGDRAIAMRRASLLHALTTAGLFSGLFLGSSLISDASAATAGQALAVSVDDFNYIDTSNEPTDQTAVHEKRLRAFMTALRDDVTADRRFELVPSSCAPNCPTDGPALRDRLRAASQAGTQILIIGIVHKLSTLVQVVRIAAVDTTAQRVVFRKYFQFRGDNDEAWQRAERFVSEEVRDRLLQGRSQQ
ncbi:DUF2380 domain-containing protein [Bradyrhizobium sp. WSM 1738]|uniref:DUF2380 domain-containing protein n=1 Tax=Bradyrhizobium hereditatis TaxID=2821405 RepID=UPI001CE2BDCB|nr:DUF2380 domain-containing protein [Bradyrhizobium hereditatis]MCA6117163.1 DUF2380 domain-containing protein [Bradyrhizobium hereditatis]